MVQKSVRVMDTKRLERLLDDERFQLENEIIDLETMQAQECLDFYVKGDLKGCLELMCNYGLLGPDKMATSLNSWQLMMDCVSQMENVTELGLTVETTLIQWFVNEAYLQVLVKDKSLDDQLTTAYQFLYSSLRFWRRNVKENYAHLDTVSLSCNELILQKSRKCVTPSEIRKLCQLLELLIFDVQIDTLKRTPSLSMYTRFCQLDDQLESKFQANRMLGHPVTIDAYFRQRLQPKPKPKPRSRSRTKSKPKPKPVNELEHAQDSKPIPVSAATSSMELSRTTNLRSLITKLPNWLPAWAHSIPWSPQLIASMLVFIVSLVLPLARRSATFQIIWRHSRERAASVLKLLVNAINSLAAL